MNIKPTALPASVRNNKSVLMGVSYEDFKLVCEELNVVEDALRQLWALALTTEDDKLRTDIYKWLIEMNVGRARQNVDITSKGSKLTAGIFIDDQEDIQTAQLSKAVPQIEG